MRSRVAEDESVKVARYLNSLRWNIQDQLSLLTPTTVQGYHQLAIKVEEKLKKKQDLGKSRGRGRDFRGKLRGGSSGRTNDQSGYGESKQTKKPCDASQRGGYNRGRGSNNGGRGNQHANGEIVVVDDSSSSFFFYITEIIQV